MQIARFSNGGFALHAITSLSKANISAWFDAGGVLLDAEYSPSQRPVAPSGPVRDALIAMGPRYTARP